MTQNKRVNFNAIVEGARFNAADSAWKRAKKASLLRHLMAKRRRFKAAKRFAKVKAEALQLAASLLPEQIVVTIDNDYQIGLVSVSWPGRGKLHLPATTPFSQLGSMPF